MIKYTTFEKTLSGIALITIILSYHSKPALDQVFLRKVKGHRYG
jgi:hypothetical protein